MTLMQDAEEPARAICDTTLCAVVKLFRPSLRQLGGNTDKLRWKTCVQWKVSAMDARSRE